MKILLLSGEYPPETPGWGGIGSYVVCVAKALARRGHEVHVLSCALGHVGGDGVEEGVWVHRRRLVRARGATRLGFGETAHRLLLGAQAFLAARVLRCAFDVIEYPEWDAEGWLFALRSKVPLIAHLHTPLSLALRQKGMRDCADTRIAGMLEKLSVRRATVVTSPSVILADEIASSGWLNRGRIRVVCYPIEWREWADTPSASQTPPVVQFAGRFDARKAPEVLIDAIAIVRREVPEAMARFAGDYQVDPSFGLPALPWARVKTFEGCSFAGHVPRKELKNLYASSRVFAQPSVFENFSYAALEAMASGRAVIVTSQSGLAGFVEKNGAGKVVPARDPEALAAALKPFLIDPSYAAEVGERARRAVARELDPERIAALREEVYRSAIGASERSNAGGFVPRSSSL